MAKKLETRSQYTYTQQQQAGHGSYRIDESRLSGKQPMELSDYLRVLRTRWAWIALAIILGLAGSLLATSMMTPKYSAKAVLFIQAQSANDTSYARSQFALQRVGSYPQLINDPLLIEKVRGELDTDMDFEAIKESLSATNPADTVLLAVTGQASEPRVAANLANVSARVLAKNIEALENTNPEELVVTATLSVRATMPADPISPRKTLNAAVGLVFGLSFGLLLAMFIDRVDPRILRAKDTERIIKLPVIGEVLDSQQHHKGGPRKLNGYRQLLSNILLSNDGHLPRRILVLNSNSGTHFDAEQLGIALASMGKKAIVVYGDAQQQQLVPGSEPGVSEVLTGMTSLDVAVQQREHIPMGILPAGTTTQMLRKFDASRLLESLICELEASYDVVIVMTTSEAEPVDGAAAALHCDCVLVTAKTKQTTYKKLRQIVDDLSAVRVGATGLVIIHGKARG